MFSWSYVFANCLAPLPLRERFAVPLGNCTRSETRSSPMVERVGRSLEGKVVASPMVERVGRSLEGKVVVVLPSCVPLLSV